MAGWSDDPLVAAHPGERWVVRSQLPDGSATDIVGWIEALDPVSVRLVTTAPARRVIERSMIIAARRAPAAAGGPHPRRISAHDVQRHALHGWLAWREPLGEWTLRRAGGFTRRANSCHAVGDPGISIKQAAEEIIGFAVIHDIPALAQVIEGSPEDRALQGLGWVSTDQPTAVLTSRLADFLEGRPADPVAKITETLQPNWEEAYQRNRPNSADPDIVRMILKGNPPRAFAAVTGQGSELVAIARGHRKDDWLGVASISTRSDHRRRGLATAMMAALGHWSARQGARYAYLQVATVNEPAIAAYRSLGFIPHHSYRYLAPAARGRRSLSAVTHPPGGFSQMTRSVGA